MNDLQIEYAFPNGTKLTGDKNMDDIEQVYRSTLITSDTIFLL